ncbi:MAG: D-alanyl-D-alanine carboxypeptidase family protein [Candidatus Zipacnadales bacterium]
MRALCLAFSALWFVGTFPAAQEVVPPPPPIEAAAAFLVQAQSGAVLYEKNAFEARPPASLTKMVTALVTMDHCTLDEVATVSAKAAQTSGSALGLREGETITVRELLKGLLLPSGNDAAVCLAEHVAGSEAAFTELMNAKAAALGAVNTHFANASGLTAEGHYSCARDLAIFALAVRLDPYLSYIVRQPSAEVTWCNGRHEQVRNLNRLLPRFQGCDGVKTGFTTPAGRCLAASAQRDGYALVCVVLRSPDSWGEAAALLNWGFAQPPVAVIVVNHTTSGEPIRFTAPLIENRLYINPADLLSALGYSAETNDSNGEVWLGSKGLRFCPEASLVSDGHVPMPELGSLSWRGKIVVPAVGFCRLLGFSLQFDKPTLTARVSLPSHEPGNP